MNMAESGYWQMHARSPYTSQHYSDFMLVCFDLEQCLNSGNALNYSRREFEENLLHKQNVWSVNPEAGWRSEKNGHHPKGQFLSFKTRPECIDAMRKTRLQGDFYESIFGNLNPCGNMSLPKIENESEQQMFYMFARNYILEEAVLVSKFVVGKSHNL